jgi:sulfite exporter TauE/SafE
MLAVFIAGAAAGLLSAPHCALMCGPVAAYSSRSAAKGGARYHVGRALGYGGAGTLAGLLGQPVVHLLWDSNITLALSWSLALLMAIAAYRAWPRAQAGDREALVQLTARKGSASNAQVGTSALLRLLRRGAGQPILLGLLSVFIPCAALWSGLIMAAASGSAGAGAIAMGAFSLTSATGLLASGWLASRVRARPRHHRVLALVFAVGALVLVLRPLSMQQESASQVQASEAAPPHCPLHPGGML